MTRTLAQARSGCRYGLGEFFLTGANLLLIGKRWGGGAERKGTAKAAKNADVACWRWPSALLASGARPPCRSRYTAGTGTDGRPWRSPRCGPRRPGHTGPVIQVLEQMPADGAQMGKAEAPAGNALGGTLDYQPPLDGLKPSRPVDPELVTENRGAGIGIPVVFGHSAARARTWARMWARRRSCVQPSRSNISNIATSTASSGLPSISCRRMAARSRWRASAAAGGVRAGRASSMAQAYHKRADGVAVSTCALRRYPNEDQTWLDPRRREDRRADPRRRARRS